MLTGIFVIITLIPFQIFFTLWNALFTALDLNITITEPAAFGDTMIWMFQKAYFMDSIFPTAALIKTLILSINIFIGLGIWTLVVWVYNRVRGA